MNWINQFSIVFLFPLITYSVACLGWYWSDNTSYPWKHWTSEQTLGFFSFGPVISSALTGVVMIYTMWNEEFVFERWFVAVMLLVIAADLWLRYTRFSFNDRSPEEKEALRRQWEAAGSPLP